MHTSQPVGSRFDISMIPKLQRCISRILLREPKIRMRLRAEAMGQLDQAKTFYEMAGRFTATYYGQLARARLGLKDLGLRGPPLFSPQERSVLSNLEVVRAAEILYALDEQDMLASIYAELGESATDIAGMAILGELAAKHNDGRSMLLLGEYAYARGLPLDY